VVKQTHADENEYDDEDDSEELLRKAANANIDQADIGYNSVV
jgi:hypothetical protein